MTLSPTAEISLPSLSSWISEIHHLTGAERVRICDGSASEWDELTSELVDAGRTGYISETI